MINSFLASTLLVHDEASNEAHHMMESVGFNWPTTVLGFGWFVIIAGAIITVLIIALLVMLILKLNKMRVNV